MSRPKACYYKDEKDRICQYIWSGDTELRDIEDYYSRKKYIWSMSNMCGCPTKCVGAQIVTLTSPTVLCAQRRFTLIMQIDKEHKLDFFKDLYANAKGEMDGLTEDFAKWNNQYKCYAF